jgi:ADP-heptose:LPS heptosyltransferase
MQQAGVDSSHSTRLIPVRPIRRLAGIGLNILAAIWRLLNQLRRGAPNRILVVDPVALGDIITCEPLIRELLKGSEEIVVCSKPAFSELFPPHPRLRWLGFNVPFGSPDEKAKYDLRRYISDPFRSDFRELKNVARGTTALELRGDIRCVLLLYAAGCRRVLSLSNYLGSDARLWPGAVEIIPFEHGIRRWELNLRFLMNLRRSDPRSSPPRFHHLIHPAPSNRICFMPVAPWPGKFWEPGRWKELAREFHLKGFAVVSLCGPGQQTEARTQTCGETEVLECGSIFQWINELNNCCCLITVDSGPMHLADAMDVPLVALFGQGKLPLWSPSNRRSRYIHHQDDADFVICQPIFKNIPLGRKFMDRITVHEVLNAAAEVMHIRSSSIQS